MSLIRQYASNDSIIMFGYSYDPTLNGNFKVTVIATGFSAEKAGAFQARRPLTASNETSVRAHTVAEDIFTTFEPQRPTFEDPMLIPAYLRRKKRSV